MIITYNKVFSDFISKYNIAENLQFELEVPKQLLSLLNEEIIRSDFGISLKFLKGVYNNYYKNLPYDEDLQNHFHIVDYVVSTDDKEIFKLGIYIIKALATRFELNSIRGVRFWYSFQTPELGKIWSVTNGLHDDEDEYYVNERLSFHTRREDVEVASLDNQHWAVLIVDI